MTPKALFDFIGEEGNIFLALSGDSATPSSVSSLLLEFDLTLPPDRLSHVVDHFNYDTLSASEKHDALLLPRPAPLRPDVKDFFGGDGVLALPRAVAQTLGNANPLVNPVVKAPATSYSYSPKEEEASSEDPFATGQQISLVSTLQARNSARFTVLGSVEALQNKWFEANVQKPAGSKTKTANRDFASRLTQWTFKEIGVLKVGAINHQLSSVREERENKSLIASDNPTMYRVKNDVVRALLDRDHFWLLNIIQTFRLELFEYDVTHYSAPKLPSGDEIQLEFTMLSPFHRLNLEPKMSTPNSTIYGASFTCPDQHGIFAFKVNYKRPFFTNIDVKEQVTVRHFAHDEYPRSWRISGGWVWIIGVWMTVAGWIAFVGVWLWAEPKKSSEKKTQ